MNTKKLFNIISLFGIAATIIYCIYCIKTGIFSSQESLERYVSGFGRASGIVFVFIQIIQVVIPIIPGGISCLAGVVLFGSARGFIYNYVGICIGSVIIFMLARIYGRPLMQAFFDAKLIQKYECWMETDRCFAKLFALAIFLPVAPDDFLCCLAGTTKMKLREFVLIILLGKPFAIAAYSLGLNCIFKILLNWH